MATEIAFDDLFVFPAEMPFEVDDIDEVVIGWFPNKSVKPQYAYQMYEEAQKRWREYPTLKAEIDRLNKLLGASPACDCNSDTCN